MEEDEIIIDSESSREDIVSLQTRLEVIGYPLPRYGADGDYGGETISAVEEFQRNNNLEVTGIATVDTLSLIDQQFARQSFQLDMELRHYMLSRAACGVGVMETEGDNSSPQIFEFLQRNDPLSWCAGFMSHVSGETNLFDYSLGAKQIMGQFDVQDAYYPHDSEYAPQPGDLIFFERGDDGDWRGHVGIVEEVLEDGTIITIEGNKNHPDFDGMEDYDWDPERPDGVRRVTYAPGELEENRVLGYGNSTEMYIARNGYDINFNLSPELNSAACQHNTFMVPEI